jgi:hypothetical protein
LISAVSLPLLQVDEATGKLVSTDMTQKIGVDEITSGRDQKMSGKPDRVSSSADTIISFPASDREAVPVEMDWDDS